MILAPALRRTLAMTIDALQGAHDPWWIISGAAVALHGVGPIEVGDVDLLLSIRDADALLERLGVARAMDSGTAQFQSTIFAQWTKPPLTVDIMADFHVATDHGWTRVVPRTRVPVKIDGCAIYIPDRAALAATLRLFGRPKDLERAALLESTCAPAKAGAQIGSSPSRGHTRG